MSNETMDLHKKEKEIIISTPLGLNGGLEVELQVPSLLQQIFTLLRNVGPGFDLNYLQVPPLLNYPKSLLQFFGECVCCIRGDYLSNCNNGKNSLERFISIVAWSISTTRPLIFGKPAFNPILGETHHITRGSLNVLLEQVSHHPPVFGLHSIDTKENIEMIWTQHPVLKFHGTHLEADIKGKRKVKLSNFNETYEMNCPSFMTRFLPSMSAEWQGNVHIRCKESNLHADICYYRSNSFLGFGGSYRAIKGKIFDSQSLRPIYEIHGYWDKIVTLKDIESGDTQILYEGKAISNLITPVVKDIQQNLWPSESAVVWSEVNRSIMRRDWKRASEAKREVEERERRLRSERKSKGEVWVPKHFVVTQNNGDWDCVPLEQIVPPAPIIVPI